MSNGSVDDALLAAAMAMDTPAADVEELSVEEIETPARLPPAAKELKEKPAPLPKEEVDEETLKQLKEQRKAYKRRQLKWHDASSATTKNPAPLKVDEETLKEQRKAYKRPVAASVKKEEEGEQKKEEPPKKRVRGVDVADAFDSVIRKQRPWYREQMALAAAVMAGVAVYTYAPAIVAAKTLM